VVANFAENHLLSTAKVFAEAAAADAKWMEENGCNIHIPIETEADVARRLGYAPG
jgi:hypothetical protein